VFVAALMPAFDHSIITFWEPGQRRWSTGTSVT